MSEAGSGPNAVIAATDAQFDSVVVGGCAASDGPSRCPVEPGSNLGSGVEVE